MAQITDRVSLGNALQSLMMASDITPGDSASKFYLYVLYRASDGVPCYVGKGTGKRWTHHASMSTRHYNRRLAALFARDSVDVAIVFRSDCEADVFALEIALIAALREAGVDLYNMKAGGAGAPPDAKPEAHRLKISLAMRGRKNSLGCKRSDAHKQALRDSARRQHANMTPAQREARSKLISERTRAAMAKLSPVVTRTTPYPVPWER